MRLTRPAARPKNEGTITLINVVFLMLIFFLIAGTLTPPLDNDITLIDAQTGEPVKPPDTLSARANGDLFFRGNLTTAEAFLSKSILNEGETSPAIKIMVDKELPAPKLIDIVAELRGLGASSVRVVTRRAGQ